MVVATASHSARSSGGFSLATLEAHRDFHFRRVAARSIRSDRAALAFVEEVGFCSAFTAGLGLPCLREAIVGQREPALPEHIQHDYAIGMVWRLKDTLPRLKQVYYGKVFSGRPGFVALDLIPSFLRLRVPAGGYRAMYRRGELLHCAKLVMDQLARRGPCETRALKLASGYAAPNKRTLFDNAMRQLQENFLALKVEERQQPFTYVWDSVAHQWAEPLRAARELSPAQAVLTLVRKFFHSCGYATESRVAQLIGISRAHIAKACAALEREGHLVRGTNIEGLSGTYTVLACLRR